MIRISLTRLVICLGITLLFALIILYKIDSFKDSQVLQRDAIESAKNVIRYHLKKDSIQQHPTRRYEMDFKKSISFLMEDMNRRIDNIEKVLDKLLTNNSDPYSSLNQRQLKDYERKELVNILKISRKNGILESEHHILNDLLEFLETSQYCYIEEMNLAEYPKCLPRIEALKLNPPDVFNEGKFFHDGSDCSFFIYASEIERYCPVLLERRILFSEFAEKMLKTDMNITEIISVFGDIKLDFIRKRLDISIGELTKYSKHFKSLFPSGKKIKKLNILFHLEVMENLEKDSMTGGPLGELVQYADIISATKFLGHRVTITSTRQNFQQKLKVDSLNDPNDEHGSGRYDLIFTTISSFKKAKSIIDSSKDIYPKSVFRIFDSFGTSLGHNQLVNSEWGGLKLNLNQFLTFFPHSQDNTFLGFIVEFPTNLTNYSKTGRPKALLYAKHPEILKKVSSNNPVVNYLKKFHKNFEIHSTINGKVPEVFEKYLINHGTLTGAEYFKLLDSCELLIGIGFPIEGPAPLEAISRGLYFVQPNSLSKTFQQVVNDFFLSKPTYRRPTSQNDYLKEYANNTKVQTLNLDNLIEVERVADKLFMEITKKKLLKSKKENCLPFEFSAFGLIERLFHIYEEQTDKINHFPVEHEPEFAWKESQKIVLGNSHQTCSEVCRSLTKLYSHQISKNLSQYLTKREMFLKNEFNFQSIYHWECDRFRFSSINHPTEISVLLNQTCSTVKYLPDDLAPYVIKESHSSIKCIGQMNILHFNCDGRPGKANVHRVCPCTLMVPGQFSIPLEFLQNI